jgi:hypothetical protein
MNISGNALSSTFPEGIYTVNVSDLTNTSNIELYQNTIDLRAQNVLVNGGPLQPGGGGIVTNPLNSNLSIGVFDINNLPGGQTIRSITNLTIATEEKTVNIESATFPTSTTMNGILRIPTVTTDLITDPLESSSIEMTTGGINMTSTDININGNSTISGTLKTDIKLITPYIVEESKTSSILLEATGIAITSPALLYNSNAIITATGTQQQYIMGDGSLLQYSANSGNSNFYLYKSHSGTPGVPPQAGFVVYNTNIQATATVIYISHLTDDVIDIEVFFNNLNQINDVYLQDRNDSTNYIKYNITGAPTIITNSYISIPVSLISAGGSGAISFGTNHDILLSFFTNNIEVDTRISALETKTQHITNVDANFTVMTNTLKIPDLLVTDIGDILGDGSYINLTQTEINITSANLKHNTYPVVVNPNFGSFTSNSFIVPEGVSTEFLKADGTLDSNTYATGISTQINSSVSYINNLGKVSSNVSNLYVQLGENTIQSAITVIGVGYNIQCSSGASTENIILNKQNYTLCGAPCVPFGASTQITGNVTIGDAVTLSTRIKMKCMKIVGDLTFVSSVNNELRTLIYNCEFSGNITFPAVAGFAEFYAITFTECYFYGANPIVIPNQNTYRITFSRCIFFGQTITNNLILANTNNLLFESCTGFASLSLGNCVKLGNLITMAGVITQFTSNLSMAGASTSFVKGDGSLDTRLYSFRKFSKITDLTLNGIQTNGNMMTGTFSPSLGYQFLANEAIIGNVYKLVVQGLVFNSISMTFNVGFLNSTHTITSTSTTAVTAPYLLEITYTVRTSTVLSINAICDVYFRNGANLAQFGYSSSNTVTANITTASSVTLTYTNTGNASSTFFVNQMYLMKI